MRRLIVNADDFGLTPGINRAIAEAHSRGIVTSATLMANSSAFENAVELTSGLPQLSVGCHVILVDGAPLLERSQVKSLISSNASGPVQFHTSLATFAGRALTGQFDESQIEAEATAQIQKLQASGIVVSHLDTHKHTHIFPVVARPLLRAAKACGVPAVRNPFSSRAALSAGLVRTRPTLWKRYLQMRALSRLRMRFLRLVAETRMLTTDGSLGVLTTGILDPELLEKEIGSIAPGIWELVCHPGYSDADLDRVKTRLRQSRFEELNLLTSFEVRAALSRRGVELLSYRELAASGRPRLAM